MYCSMAVGAMYKGNSMLDLPKISSYAILGENLYGKTRVKFTEYFTPEPLRTSKMGGEGIK